MEPAKAEVPWCSENLYSQNTTEPVKADVVEQSRSKERLLQTCSDFGLPEPLISIDIEETWTLITASWLRYDLVINILPDGSWVVDDLSKSPRDISALPKNRETEWCRMLKSRVGSISPGAGPNDMGNREQVPW